MPKPIHFDAGTVIGRLTVLERLAVEGRSHFRCKCECGVIVIVLGSNMKRGDTRSCGCLHRDQLVKRSTTHGSRYRAEYLSWAGAKGRCFNARNKYFARYGGRGITMCDRWRYSFATFLADMGSRPANAELERINNDGAYEPSNCRWASRTEQVRNRSTTRRLTWMGVTRTLAEWASHCHLDVDTVENRYELGWSPERILTQPKRRSRANAHRPIFKTPPLPGVAH